MYIEFFSKENHKRKVLVTRNADGFALTFFANKRYEFMQAKHDALRRFSEILHIIFHLNYLCEKYNKYVTFSLTCDSH